MINTPKIYKMRIVFRAEKMPQGALHIFDAVRKMVLASGLPFAPAKVNPRWPRLAYGPSPAQGQRAMREYLDIYLQKLCSTEDVRHALEAAAPQGICLLDVRRVPYGLPSVQHLAAAVRYRLTGNLKHYGLTEREQTERDLQAVKLVQRAANGLRVEKDLSAYIEEVRWQGAEEVVLTIRCIQDTWLRPELVVAAWAGIEVPAGQDEVDLPEITVVRQAVCWRDSAGVLHDL